MTLRFLIVIPVFNHPKTVFQVVSSCLRCTNFSILIVDDGSSPSIKELINEQGHLFQYENNDRIHLFTHNVNQGIGAALRSGFSWALKYEFTHVITLDADGQHFPEDISKLVQKSYENPWSLILGDRDMTGPHIPDSSIFGKKFSNFWVHFETQKRVGDSQSGFRIYPLFHIQNTAFLCEHYDFEVEVLTKLIWKNVKIENVKIQVLYQNGVERVTHFNKWKDNLRLTFLNAMLVIMSLLKSQNNPFKNSLSMALGVVIGTTPFFGFHTFIAIILSMISRLNLVLMWIGTHISMPLLIPFLLVGTKFIYNHLFNENIPSVEFNMILMLGSRWIISSFLLGLILGSIVFVVSYIIQYMFFVSSHQKIKLNQGNNQENEKWSKKSNSQPGIIFIKKLMEIAGIRVTYIFLYAVVPFYFINFRLRKAMAEYWRAVFPNMSSISLQTRMFRQLILFAQNLVDRAFLRVSQKCTLKVYNDQTMKPFIEYLEDSTNKKPCILMSSHFGGWELAMTAFNNIKTNKKMLVVMHDNGHGQDHYSTDLMDREKFEIIYFNKENNSILKIKNYLENGNIVGLMGDRPVGRSYELIHFFNKLCVFDSTPFRLADLLKSDIFYLFCVKEDMLTYRLSVIKSEVASKDIGPMGLDLIESDKISDFEQNYLTEQRQIKIKKNMREYTTILEGYVKKNPDQWMNFYPFFSTYPEI